MVSAIGSFVRAWLYAMGAISGLAGSGMAWGVYDHRVVDLHQAFDIYLIGNMAGGFGLMVVLTFMFASLPAAAVIIVAHIALKW